MKDMTIHILLPFTMPSVTSFEELPITEKLAYLVEPEQRMTRSILHIEGRSCNYRLDVIFRSDSPDCAKRVAEAASERLIGCFELYRGAIDAQVDVRAGEVGSSKRVVGGKARGSKKWCMA